MNRTNKTGHLEPGNTAAAGKEAMKHEAGKREVEIKTEILKYRRTDAKKGRAEKRKENHHKTLC